MNNKRVVVLNMGITVYLVNQRSDPQTCSKEHPHNFNGLQNAVLNVCLAIFEGSN